MIRFFTVGFILIFVASVCKADEIRPAYLELKEQSNDFFTILWKVPAKGEKKLSLNIEFPSNCNNTTSIDSQLISNAYIQRWTMTCAGGLANNTISIPALQFTNTDVLLRAELLNNISLTAHLTPTEYSYKVPEKASSLKIIKTYIKLGIMHILLGIDHLLFVFALFLIVKSSHLLFWTITAFTLSHSITLAGATLGLVFVPQKPVEAIIALSILFLAIEITHVQQGKMSIAAEKPWLVAFIFGLLHGFGFAGALAEVGLPEHAISLALIFFNIGVELGQLIFIVAVLIVGWFFVNIFKLSIAIAWTKMITVYSIGSISAFWLIERISTF